MNQPTERIVPQMESAVIPVPPPRPGDTLKISPNLATSPRLPEAPLRKSRRLLWGLAAVAILVIVVLTTLAVTNGKLFQDTHADLLTYRVHPESIKLTIVERGALESSENRDVVCRVKAKGNSVATTIKWVIDDGSLVKHTPFMGCSTFPKCSYTRTVPDDLKSRVQPEYSIEVETICPECGATMRLHPGDLLVLLDDSGLQEQLKAERIVVDQANSFMIQAEENYKIVASQNNSDIQSAKVVVELARLDLEKYLNGDYLQTLKDVESRLELWRDRAAWSDRMVKKGYVSRSQAQADRLSLEKVEEEMRVLERYTKQRTTTDLQSKVDESIRALERVEKQTKAKEVQADTDRKSKKSVHNQELSRLRGIESEICKCTLTSPQDGMVVYFVSEQSRYSGSRQSLVAQGESVVEAQKLLRIPNLNKMTVNVRVHEAMIARVHAGQPAHIRIDAFPDRQFVGHVDQIATVASQQDWMYSDVKVYQTMVTVDDLCEGLKPGMSAEVTILVNRPLDNVLTIPIQGIIGSAEMGKQRQCFVLTQKGPEKRDIVLGLANDKMAEVRSGLEEGEEVILNPQRLLNGAKVKTRVAGNSGSTDGNDPSKGADPSKSGADKKGQLDSKQAPTDEGPRPGAEPKPAKPKESGTPEEREKRMKEMAERFSGATPEQRKEMLQKVDERFRDGIKQMLKAQGIDVPD